MCFLLRIAPEQRERYLEAHERVWPEMLDALLDSGYRNYSVFLDDSGLLVLYFEAEDPDATLARMSSTEANKRWSEFLEGTFIPVDSSRPIGAVIPLAQVFDFDEQLMRVDNE